MAKQKTIQSTFSLQGKGLHTGVDITIIFNPAPENHGIIIQRIDLPNQPTIKALAENVNGTTRGTVLSKSDIQISTIEHALAALYSFEVDNCLIQVDAPEFPILDGSSKYYIEQLEVIGTEVQKSDKEYFIVKSRMEYIDEETGSSITLLPDDKFSLDVHIEYPSPILSNQFAQLNNLSEFKDQIGSCRTFVFVREVEPLLKQNLIKGGDLENAIVIYDKELGQEEFNRIAELTNHKTMDAKKLGYLSGELKFSNEPARHKLLDVIGDLSLIGMPIIGKVIANRPGHKLNTNFAKQIRKQIKKQEFQAPLYNPDAEPLMDINQVKGLLPHRWPFLLVDKIIEIGSEKVVGGKKCNRKRNILHGTFPIRTRNARGTYC